MGIGSWSAVMPWPLIGLHAALLPDGRVLTFGTDETGEQGAYKFYDIWDPKTGVHLTETKATTTDEFCSAEMLDPITDNVIITGGDARPLGRVNKGVADVNTFDYRSGTLTTSATGDLNFPRWYGSLISLGGGRFLEIGGENGGEGPGSKGSGTPELFTPGIGWTALPGAYSGDIAANWFYPRVWLSSDGTIFGFSTQSEGSNAGTIFTINTTGRGSVTNLGHTPFESESYDPAAMFAQDKILTIDKNGDAWIMDISGATPTFTKTGNVGSNRAWSNLTDLADGTVLITGGSNGLGPSGNGNVATETNNAMIWNPGTGEWTNDANAAIGRFYHSNTLLLPDGRVLSAGGGAPGPLTNLNAEIYTPGYLLNDDGSLRTDRPVITSAPAMLQQGQTFTITVDDADVIEKLELIKFGNATHSFDGEQRAFSLEFTHLDANTLQVTIPANANLITDGYWLLFANNAHGTPSVAASIKISQVGVDTSVPGIGTNLMLNGTASHSFGSDVFTLTTDNLKQAGSVMSDKRIDLTHDFDLSFALLMGNKAYPGDGISFVLHNDASGNNGLGANGGGLGAAGLSNGIAIQFDAFQSKELGDIKSPHTDLVTTDPQADIYRLSAQVPLNNLTDGNWHSVHVYWDATSRTLTYTFDGVQVGQLSGDLADAYFGGSTSVYFGFTGATGGKSDLQEIRLDSLNATFDASPPASAAHPHDGSILDVSAIGQHVTLNGSASFDSSGNTFTLTSDAGGQAGSAIFNDKVDLTHDFNMLFDFYFGPKQSGEGMAFLLHNDPSGAAAIGDSGDSLGAMGLQNGLAIAFDSQQDDASFNAMTGANLTPALSLANLDDGGWHQVGVVWDAQTQTLRSWIDGKLVGSLSGDITTQYLGGSTTAYIGFSGATGTTRGASQQVRVAAVDAYFSGASDEYANIQDPIGLSSSAFLNGAASYDSAHNNFVLTPDATNRAGSVMLGRRVDMSYDFQTSFDVYLGNNDKGGDGLAFILQNAPLGPAAIGGIGDNYGALGIKNGFGIAFDTWQNANLGDMAGDHTDFFNTGAALANNRISDQLPLGTGNVEDGQWHNVLVTWNATDQTLTYWFDGELAGTLKQNVVAKYLGGSPYAYLGFSAGTGGAHNLQEVHLNSLTATFYDAMGNDTYVVNNSADIVNEADGGGIDTIRSSISFSLADAVHAIGDIENLTLTGKANINATGNALDNVLIGNSGNNVLIGGAGADTLDGGGGTDTASYIASASGVAVSLATGGGAGGDAEGDHLFNIENLIGSNYDDTLEGNAGNNKLVGGLGTDTVSYADATSGANGVGVTVNLALTSAQNTVRAGTDTLSGFENLTGSQFNDTLIGSGGVNVLMGLGGNDLLNGGAGADHMYGGTGNDTYVVDNVGDVVDETDGDGLDLVKASISFSLADAVHAIGDIENLTLTGTANINATGNALDNVLIGNSGANVLTGLDGNDTLNGGGGADHMFGGTGNDTYVVDNRGDIVDESGGDGIDTVQSLVSFSLADPVHAIGDIENLTLTGTANINATGNELDNVLIGNSGANVLTGLDGNDTLNGGAGADKMYGGTGNDTYVVDNAGDVVNETGGSGIDTVLSSVSFSLADPKHAIGDIENLTLTGTANINATGNALDNVLIGNSGANVLIGGAGADTLDGGAGIDTASYATSPAGVNVSLMTGMGHGGDAEGDTLSNIENLTGSKFNDTLEGNAGNNVLAGGAGNDTVSYAHATSGPGGLGVTVNLAVTTAQNTVTAGTDTLTGFENLTGSQFNDTLTGTTGNNVITGLGGNDTLTGGGGNDTFVFGPNFGKTTITDFTADPTSSEHDQISFDHNTFADFEAVIAASAQVGADTVISVDADHSVTLTNVNLSTLHHDAFTFT